MKKGFFSSLALVASVLLSASASATVVVNEGFGDNSYLSNCVTDRYAPTSVGVVSGELQLTTDDSRSASNRPTAYSSAFYNTQGIKCTAPAGVIRASVDILTDSNWLALPGVRRAGFWATGEDDTDSISSYPLMEVASSGTGLFLQMWDLTGAFSFGGSLTMDAWHRFTIEVDVANDLVNYYLDNALAGTYGANGTTSFRDTMFQTVNTFGPNQRGSLTVAFDNLVLETADGGNTVSEPGTLVLAGLSLMSLGFLRRRGRPLRVA